MHSYWLVTKTWSINETDKIHMFNIMVWYGTLQIENRKCQHHFQNQNFQNIGRRFSYTDFEYSRFPYWFWWY